MLKNIGIIGNGFVGKAVKESFRKHFDVFIFDKDKRKANEVESLKTFTVQADLNQAVVEAERWITEYIANNSTTRFKAEEAYAANLIKN